MTWNKPIEKIIDKANFPPWGGFKQKMPPVKNKIDQKSMDEAADIAHKVLHEGLKAERLKKGKYLYFNHYKRGRKYKTDVPLVRIGDHVFY